MLRSVNNWAFALVLLAPAAWASSSGVTANTITVGQSAALSGPARELGEETRMGIELCFDTVNAKGGVYGRKLKLVSLDDAYDPTQARNNTLKLVAKNNVFALLGYVGTDTSVAAMPVFSYYEVPFVGAVTGTDLIRVPYNRYIFNIRAGFTDEADRIVKQLIGTGIRNIAVFYESDAHGLDGLEAVRTALEQNGLSLAASGSMDRTSGDVSSAVYLIKRASPDAVIMFAPYQHAAAFIRSMRMQGSTAQFYNTSLVGSDALVKELGKQSHGVVVSQVMPHPYSGTSLIVREYKKELAAAGRAPSYGSMEGYVSARVFVEALQRAGRNPTREALIAALEGMRNVDLDGFNTSFSPDNHNGSGFVDLTIVARDGRFLH